MVSIALIWIEVGGTVVASGADLVAIGIELRQIGKVGANVHAPLDAVGIGVDLVVRAALVAGIDVSVPFIDRIAAQILPERGAASFRGPGHHVDGVR